MDVSIIKRLAKEQGVKIQALCELVGRPKYYLNDVQRNGQTMPMEYLLIIADKLGTTPDYLLGISDTKEKLTTVDDGELPGLDRELISLMCQSKYSAEDYRKIKALFSLTPEEIRRVLDFAEGLTAARGN